MVGVEPPEAVADRLYALPPDEFIAARDAAAAEAKKAGDAKGAATIAKLRKPTVGAWLVNLLAHECPDLVAQLLALGEQLRTAQRNLRGDELRALSQRRRETVATLAARAGALGRRRARGNLPLGEVEATLTAALAEPEVAEQVRAGRLTKTVSYAGFGEPPRPQLRVLPGGRSAAAPKVDAAEAAPAPARTDRAAPPPATAERTQRTEAEAERAEAERREAEQAAAIAEAERKAAERAAAAAVRAERRRMRAAAHRELMEARTELADAEAARAAAEKAVVAARRRVDRATDTIATLDDGDD